VKAHPSALKWAGNKKRPAVLWVLRKRRAYADISGFINLLHGLIFRRLDKKRLLLKAFRP